MSMTVPTMEPNQSTAVRARRIAFFVLVVILSLFICTVFTGVTGLTVGMWLAKQNHVTTPVGDLSFFALGVMIIGAGFVAQLWAPEHHVAGIQQAVMALLALAVAGLLGARIEPLVGGLLFLLAAAIVVALHPERREVFALGKGMSAPLAALSLLAVPPAVIYATHMLGLARQAGASCFLGRCAYGDRFAEMAACAIAIVLVGMLAALKTQGWRIPAWSAGLASMLLGMPSIALPTLPGTLGQLWGTLAIAWGVLLIGVAEWEARQAVRLAGPDALGRRTPTS